MIAIERINVSWYEPNIDLFLKQPQGAVGRYLKGRAAVFTNAARAQAGVQTGMLKASIRTMEHSRAPYGQMMKIGADVRHALWHHEGTRPHVIVPQRARILRFAKNGRVVFAHKVMHPGTRPNRYLSDNLKVFFA